MWKCKKILVCMCLMVFIMIGSVIICGCSPYYFTDRNAGSNYLQDKYHKSFTFNKNSQNGNIFFPPADEHPTMYFVDDNNNEFSVRYNKQSNEFQDNYQAYQFAPEFSEKLTELLGSNYKIAINCMSIELNKNNAADSLNEYLVKAKNKGYINIDIYTTDTYADAKNIANIILNNFKYDSYFIKVYKLKDASRLDKISTDWRDVNENNDYDTTSNTSSCWIKDGKIKE